MSGYDLQPADGTWYARVIATVAGFDVLFMTQVPWGVPRAGSAGVLHNPWLLTALAGAALTALFLFARNPERIRWGALALGSTIFLEEILFHEYGVHEEPFYQPASALFGWLLGILIVRALAYYDSTPPDWSACRRAGLAGATAIVGATYFNAGMSKLLAEGLAWGWNPDHVRMMTLAHQPLPPTALDDVLIGYLGRSPGAGRFAAAFTLVIELGGAAFAVSKRLRPLAAIGIVVWHAGLLFSTGICFYGGLVLIVCLGFRQVPRFLTRWIRATRVMAPEAPVGARAILVAALPLGVCVVSLASILTSWTKRGAVTSLVVFIFALIALTSFPWSALWRRLRRRPWSASGSQPGAPPEPLPPIHFRAAWFVGLALAAIVTGLYRHPNPEHRHDYSYLERHD